MIIISLMSQRYDNDISYDICNLYHYRNIYNLLKKFKMGSGCGKDGSILEPLEVKKFRKALKASRDEFCEL